MAAWVDSGTMTVHDGEAAIDFSVECCAGTAVLDPDGERHAVRLLQWGEKCALARFAASGPGFIEAQFIGCCSDGQVPADPMRRAALGALAMWLHGPDVALPLDSRRLGEVTIGVATALAMTPDALARLPAPDVEALWQALALAPTAPAAAVKSNATAVPDGMTRIVIEPDPAESDHDAAAALAPDRARSDLADRSMPDPAMPDRAIDAHSHANSPGLTTARPTPDEAMRADRIARPGDADRPHVSTDSRHPTTGRNNGNAEPLAEARPAQPALDRRGAEARADVTRLRGGLRARVVDPSAPEVPSVRPASPPSADAPAPATTLAPGEAPAAPSALPAASPARHAIGAARASAEVPAPPVGAPARVAAGSTVADDTLMPTPATSPVTVPGVRVARGTDQATSGLAAAPEQRGLRLPGQKPVRSPTGPCATDERAPDGIARAALDARLGALIEIVARAAVPRDNAPAEAPSGTDFAGALADAVDDLGLVRIG